MNEHIVISRMRVPTAFAALLLSGGLAFLAVPSAAADELLPTPAVTSEGGAPAETVAAPTPEPSDAPTNEVSAPATEETVAPTEAADPSQPAEEADDPQPAEGSEATGAGGAGGAAESVAPTGAQEAAPAEGAPISSQAISEPVLDPRASVGDLNCADLALPVTLDNSRSTGAVGFWLLAEGTDGDFSYDKSVVVAAGATEAAQIPVTGVSGGVYFSVSASNETAEADLASGFVKVNCAVAEPRAGIGAVNCSTLAVPVTLDNSRSLSDTTFWVFSSDSEEDFSAEDFAVPAGETRVIPIAVTEDSGLDVWVALTDDGDESTTLAGLSFGVDCIAREGGFTTATVGDLDCTRRTIPVSIDNSAVRTATGVEVYAAVNFDGYGSSWDFYDDSGVAAGAIRVVRVGPIPRSIHDPVDVFVGNVDAQTTLDDYTLASRIVQNNCPTTAARPTVAVQGVKLGVNLAQTGGFNVALPLLGVALVGTGGLLALAGRRPRR